MTRELAVERSPTLPGLICNPAIARGLKGLFCSNARDQGTGVGLAGVITVVFTVGLSNEVGFVQDVRPGGGMIQWLVHFPPEGAFHLKSTDLAWLHVPPLC